MHTPIKICSEAYFFRPEVLGPRLKVPLGGRALRMIRPEKIHPFTSAGFEPGNLGARGKQVTPELPRTTERERNRKIILNIINIITIIYLFNLKRK